MIEQLADAAQSADNIYTVLSAFGGAFGTALLAWGVWAFQRHRNQPEPAQVEAGGQTYDVTGMADSLVAMLQNALNRIEHLESEQDSLRGVNVSLNAQNMVLRAGTRPLVLWIDGGAPPPPPEVGTDLRQVLEAPPVQPDP